MMGRLHVDLFLQDRFHLNGVSVKIRLVRSKDTFSLMADGVNPDFKVQIVDAILFARKAVLSPTVQMAHIKALENGTAKYPLRPVDCKVYTIPQGAIHTRTRTSSSGRYRNDSSCGVSTTMPTMAITLKKNSPPRITALTSWPSTSMVVKCRPNRSSQTSRPATTFEAT